MDLHVAAADTNGVLWHAIMNEDGTWTPAVNVNARAGNPGSAWSVRVTSVTGELHLTASTTGFLGASGTIWHTTRDSNDNWIPFENLNNVVGNPGGTIGLTGDAIAMVGEEDMHLAVTTCDIFGTNVTIWHAIRHADDNWTPFGNVNRVVGHPGPFQEVALTQAFSGLHMAAYSILSGPIWHAIRHADGTWTGFGNVDLAVGNSPGPFRHVALADQPDWGYLQLAAIDHNGTAWHTIRKDDGSWTPFENVTQTAGGDIQIWDLALGAVQSDRTGAWTLHLVGVGRQQEGNGSQLWHTAFDFEGHWTPWENWTAHLGGGQYVAVGVTGEDQSGDTGTTGTTRTAAGAAGAIPGIAQGGGSLIGRVTDGAGLPLPDLRVYLTRSDGSGLETSTGDAGQYAFNNLRLGSYTVVAGDRRRNVIIGADCSASRPEHADLTATDEPS